MESLEYLDFELEISNSDQPGHYIAHVQRSPAGEAKSEFEMPFTSDRIEVLTLKLARVRSATRRVNSPEFAAAHELGANLFKAVFKGQVRDRLRSSLEKTRSMTGTGLRLKLRLQDAPELANLPWEFLYDTDLERFIAQSIQTPIIRYLELPESPTPFKINLPLQILGMVSSPSDYRLLDVQQEQENLKNSLSPLIRSGKVKITWLSEPTLDNLRQALRGGEYHIFHFIGHGGYDNTRDQGILVFEDRDGKGSWADADRLGVLFHDHPSMRLVILNACEGARNSIDDPFASVAATLVRQGIPSVVAMQFEISDSAAIDFATEFYTVLA
ncbi:MAG: CHAT domain-containing protein, partial [Anaerolineales bacterium]